jgi:oligopeptide transport system substrate-binding protein
VFYPVTSASVQGKLFRSGQVHLTSGMPSSKVPVYQQVASTPLVNQPATRTSYIAVNLDRDPLRDLRLRRALALAIDREALTQPVFSGAATAMGHYVPTTLPGWESADNAITHDPAEARRLFAEAGFPDGKGFPELELLAVGSERGRALTTALLQMWQDVLGIRVRARNQEYQVYLDSLVTGDFDVVLASWDGGPTPSGFLDRWVTGGGTNDSVFTHPEFDHLVTEVVRQTADAGERMRSYRRAEEILLAELPIIPLFQNHSLYLRQPCVEGISDNLLGLIDFKYLSLAPMRAWEMTEDTLAGVGSEAITD